MQPFFTPENIRKPQSFPMLLGVEKRCIGNKWVNLNATVNKINNTTLTKKVITVGIINLT